MLTELAEFGPRQGHTIVVLKGYMYVIAGSSGIIFNNSGSFTGSSGSDNSESLNNELAGLKNDVWRSADGLHWDLVTADASFQPRYGHGSVVF